MTPEEYQKVQDQFLRLRGLSPEEQSEQLTEISKADPPSGDFLRKLLMADREQDFLDESTASSYQSGEDSQTETKTRQLESTSNTTHPKTIGPYRILQQIGEGGHGIVYMAEQTQPIRRRVAIKCIKPGMATKAILARFEAERQALAMMSHPSIANVIDADATETGQPYFVLELVHGIPIDQFCLENELTLEQRLNLFRQTCEAVHHAHRKGIIHRDIKPGNVLVTVDSGKPLAKVIDFGIAKALHMPLTEKTMFTEYGQIVGTLEYMSPEQAMMSQSGADVRSDVYSLGVLLYLLLTGQTPISKDQLLQDGLWELRNVLCNFQPQTPSLRLSKTEQAEKWKDRAGAETWTKNVHGDLDWITMKALAKEPEMRYDSAAELAADIANFINRDPVTARPPSIAYSIKTWTRKNRVTALITFAMLASVTIAVIGLAWGYLQSQKNLNVAVTAQSVARHRAAQLQTALQETNDERNRADAAAARLATTLKRSLLESAWKMAMNGDGGRTSQTLGDIPMDQRDSVWAFVKSVGHEMNEPSLRDEQQGAIRAIAINETREIMAVVTTHSFLEIWDLKERIKTHELGLEKGIYTSLAFSTAGTQLLVGTSGAVQLVRFQENQIEQPIQLNKGGIRSIVHCPKPNRWYVSTGANYLVAVNTSERVIEQEYRLPQRIGLLSRSADSEQIAVAGINGTTYLFSTSTLNHPQSVQGNAPCIDFSWTEKDLLATSARGNRMRISRKLRESETISWSVDKEPLEQASTPRFTHSLLADQGNLVLGSQNVVAFSDFTQNRIIPIQEFEQAISGISWVATTGDCVVRHLNGRINLIRHETIQSRRDYFAGLSDVSDGACLSRSRKSITAHENGFLKRWDNVSGKLEASVNRHTSEIMSLSVHEGQKLIASMSGDWKIGLTNLNTLEPIASLPVGLGVRSITFSQDGSLLAGGPDRTNSAVQQEGTIDIWDVSSSTASRRLKGHKNWVIGTQFFESDQRLASLALDGTVKIWSVADGHCLRTIDFSDFANGNVFQVIEATNLLLIGHADGSLTAWNIESGNLVNARSLLGSQVTGMVQTPDGKSLIVSSENESKLTCIDVTSLSRIAVFDPGIGSIVDLRADLEAGRIQIFGDQGTIRNWKIK